MWDAVVPLRVEGQTIGYLYTGQRKPTWLKKAEINAYLKEIFKFATRIMIRSIAQVLDQSNYSINDIDFIIPHQANIRIIDYVSQKLKIDKERFIVNLDRFGNTSAASVPLAMDEAYKNRRFCPGDKMVMVAFGGGLTWGAALVNWTIKGDR